MNSKIKFISISLLILLLTTVKADILYWNNDIFHGRNKPNFHDATIWSPSQIPTENELVIICPILDTTISVTEDIKSHIIVGDNCAKVTFEISGNCRSIGKSGSDPTSFLLSHTKFIVSKEIRKLSFGCIQLNGKSEFIAEGRLRLKGESLVLNESKMKGKISLMLNDGIVAPSPSRRVRFIVMGDEDDDSERDSGTGWNDSWFF